MQTCLNLNRNKNRRLSNLFRQFISKKVYLGVSYILSWLTDTNMVLHTAYCRHISINIYMLIRDQKIMMTRWWRSKMHYIALIYLHNYYFLNSFNTEPCIKWKAYHKKIFLKNFRTNFRFFFFWLFKFSPMQLQSHNAFQWLYLLDLCVSSCNFKSDCMKNEVISNGEHIMGGVMLRAE